jgi:hypothetical protein
MAARRQLLRRLVEEGTEEWGTPAREPLPLPTPARQFLPTLFRV